MQVRQVQPDNMQLPDLRQHDQMGMWCCGLPLGILLLYLIVRDGVTRGMLTAWKKRDEERLKQAVKAEQAAQAAAAAKKASRGS
jgi:hypothetical protein